MASESKPIKYTRVTIAKFEWHYLKIRLYLDPPTQPLSLIHSSTLRTLITRALTEAFGVVRSGIHVDVLDWPNDDFIPDSSRINTSDSFIKPEKREPNVGIIRVPREDLTTLWGALTLFNTKLEIAHGVKKDLRFDVLHNSPFLIALVADSRSWTRNLLTTG
ncbi:hypothetical protein G9A89_018632 [Geosiphon pyriformis]|nr:hypothetical protein G9A89_018632 [Geosiphon pyriformis]